MLTLVSCKKDPVACFSVDKGKTAKINEEVQFNAACSTDADTFEWTYKSGTTVLSTATGVLAKFKFTVKGIVKITLVAKKGSSTAEFSQDVEIL